jgi:hypothetical protein
MWTVRRRCLVATLNDEQRERYAADGFVLVENVFDEEEVTRCGGPSPRTPPYRGRTG